MRILVDAMPEKIDDCPYANCVPLSKPRTFICEMDPYMVECKGVDGCPVFMSYDEFKTGRISKAVINLLRNAITLLKVLRNIT